MQKHSMTSRNFEFIHYLLQLQHYCIQQKSSSKEYVKKLKISRARAALA